MCQGFFGHKASVPWTFCIGLTFMTINLIYQTWRLPAHLTQHDISVNLTTQVRPWQVELFRVAQ